MSTGDDRMQRIAPTWSTKNHHFARPDTRRKQKNRTHLFSVLLNIQWIPMLIGFFLARALLLDELLPFGIAYLAAVQKHPQIRTIWPLLGVLIGYYTLASSSSIVYPYFFPSLLLWIVGYRGKKVATTHKYWITWIIFSILLAKWPLLRNNRPLWFG